MSFSLVRPALHRCARPVALVSAKNLMLSEGTLSRPEMDAMLKAFTRLVTFALGALVPARQGMP